MVDRKFKPKRVRIRFLVDTFPENRGWQRFRNYMSGNSHYNTEHVVLQQFTGMLVQFSADIDMVPGFLHDPRDWLTVLKSAAKANDLEMQDIVFEVSEDGYSHYMPFCEDVANEIWGEQLAS